MTYSNNVFSFFIYAFEDSTKYNSIKLIEQKNYLIAPEPITLEEIKKLLAKTKVVAEPTDAPFPQANMFERVVDLLGLLAEREEALDKSFITQNYSFDKRQTDYYGNAARYLGLVETAKEAFKLNDSGRQIMSMPFKEKYL